MTSIVKLHPFSGVFGESPPCYLLTVDQFTFLLDCGWDETFDMTYIEQLKKHIPQVNAVLLSHPDPTHLGALPYLVGKCHLNCPIYGTIPVYKMGQMFMYDLYQSLHNSQDFDLFTLDDVDAAFDKINQLKYSQTINLKGRGHGLQITPLPAGHMIGGTVWKIVKDGEEEIVYAIDYNHKKERHLNGMPDTIQRPTVLITDAYNADYKQARRRDRDGELMDKIMETVRQDGNVLVAIDTAGRVLELAHLLEMMWRNQGSGLMAYSLAVLNNVSYNVVEFAKSQVEWMSDKIMRAFEDARNNPFQFKHVVLCHSLMELNTVPEPKVVLASVPDMECGFSRDLFMLWCGNPKNSVILTNRTSPGTLARQLIDNPTCDRLKLNIHRRVRLEGFELEEHRKREKEMEVAAKRKKLIQIKKEKMEAADSSSDDSDVEINLEKPNTKSKHDLMMKHESKARTGFFKQAKKTYPMFPMAEERIKWDDYGEIIRAEDYIMETDIPPVKDEGKNDDVVIESVTPEVKEIPTKCISFAQSVEIKARISYIDFEGRSDGESMKKILTQIKPRQLILVRGTEHATRMLAEFARNTRDCVQGKVFTPRMNEVVDATKESHIFQVKLRDSLVSALDFHNARDTELAWLEAMVDLSSSRTVTDDGSSVRTEVLSDVEMVPTLNILPLNQVRGHQSVFINEPRLSDLKEVLRQHGVQAEFSGGVLVCNNQVAVRRVESGRLQLEGCLCDDYYTIRKLLYSQYAIV